MRLTRRILRRAAFYLALGLLTTISIAWASALLAPLRGLSYSNPTCLNDFIGNGFSIIQWHLPCTDRVAWFGRHTPSPNPAASELEWLAFSHRFPHWWGRPPRAEPGAITSSLHYVQDARGWPIVALWCEWPSATTHPGPIRGGIPLAPAPQRDLSPTDPPDVFAVRGLPLRPVWLGLFADTVFLGVAWFALVTSPRSSRFAIRVVCSFAAAIRGSFRRGAPQRSIKWITLGICIALLAAAVFARRYYARVSLSNTEDTYSFVLTGKGVILDRWSYGPFGRFRRSWRVQWHGGNAHPLATQIELWPTWGPTSMQGSFPPTKAGHIAIPMWLIILPAAAATAFLFYRSLRAARLVKPCPHCSYSLIDLPPNSPCPECGHTTTT